MRKFSSSNTGRPSSPTAQHSPQTKFPLTRTTVTLDADRLFELEKIRLHMQVEKEIRLAEVDKEVSLAQIVSEEKKAQAKLQIRLS